MPERPAHTARKCRQFRDLERFAHPIMQCRRAVILSQIVRFLPYLVKWNRFPQLAATRVFVAERVRVTHLRYHRRVRAYASLRKAYAAAAKRRECVATAHAVVVHSPMARGNVTEKVLP